MKKPKPVSPRVADSAFDELAKKRFATMLADPPWRFQNSTGKVAPEHKRPNRYLTVPYLCQPRNERTLNRFIRPVLIEPFSLTMAEDGSDPIEPLKFR